MHTLNIQLLIIQINSGIYMVKLPYLPHHPHHPYMHNYNVSSITTLNKAPAVADADFVGKATASTHLVQ